MLNQPGMIGLLALSPLKHRNPGLSKVLLTVVKGKCAECEAVVAGSSAVATIIHMRGKGLD